LGSDSAEPTGAVSSNKNANPTTRSDEVSNNKKLVSQTRKYANSQHGNNDSSYPGKDRHESTRKWLLCKRRQEILKNMLRVA